MLERLGQRPILVALLIGLAAQILFGLHLTRPGTIVFDESHYVSAARILLDLERPTNVEHPLVGKTLIAGGIAVFGDNPLGWRAMSTLAGTATVMSVFAILMLVFGRIRIAAFGAGLALFNQMIFVQARIGMLDVFLGAFVLGAIAALLWAMRAPPGRVARRVALAGVALGLAVGTKWTAIPYCALAGCAVLFIRWRSRERVEQPWSGLGTFPLLALLAVTSIVTYFATFLPTLFYRTDPVTLAGLIPLQLEMYRLQTFILAPHTYQSDWWSWPMMLRPVWYFYEPDAGVQRGVLLIGNPTIFWGGLAAVALCIIGWLRDRDLRLFGVAALWVGSLAIYIVIPKSLGFFYYYYLSGIFLCIAIAAAYGHFGKGRWQDADLWLLVPVVGLFVYFYPILSGARLDGHRPFLNWTWFPGWI